MKRQTIAQDAATKTKNAVAQVSNKAEMPKQACDAQYLVCLNDFNISFRRRGRSTPNLVLSVLAMPERYDQFSFDYELECNLEGLLNNSSALTQQDHPHDPQQQLQQEQQDKDIVSLRVPIQGSLLNKLATSLSLVDYDYLFEPKQDDLFNHDSDLDIKHELDEQERNIALTQEREMEARMMAFKRDYEEALKELFEGIDEADIHDEFMAQEAYESATQNNEATSSKGVKAAHAVKSKASKASRFTKNHRRKSKRVAKHARSLVRCTSMDEPMQWNEAALMAEPEMAKMDFEDPLLAAVAIEEPIYEDDFEDEFELVEANEADTDEYLADCPKVPSASSFAFASLALLSKGGDGNVVLSPQSHCLPSNSSLASSHSLPYLAFKRNFAMFNFKMASQVMLSFALMSMLAVGLCLSSLSVAHADSALDDLIALGGSENILSAKDRQVLRALEKSQNTRGATGKVAAPVVSRPGEVQFVFGASAPTILCSMLHISDIALEPGETVYSLQIGDSARWIVEQALSGSDEGIVEHITLKPTDTGLTSNMRIYTDKRTYSLELKSTVDDYIPQVSFIYPEETLKRFNEAKQELMRQQRFNSINVQGERGKASRNYANNAGSNEAINIKDLDFDYELKGDKDLYPVRVFNDGNKTYVQMPKKLLGGQLPALVMVTDTNLFGKDSIAVTNYRLSDDKFIVDGLPQHLRLFLGKNGSASTSSVDIIHRS